MLYVCVCCMLCMNVWVQTKVCTCMCIWGMTKKIEREAYYCYYYYYYCYYYYYYYYYYYDKEGFFFIMNKFYHLQLPALQITLYFFFFFFLKMHLLHPHSPQQFISPFLQPDLWSYSFSFLFIFADKVRSRSCTCLNRIRHYSLFNHITLPLYDYAPSFLILILFTALLDFCSFFFFFFFFFLLLTYGP